MEKTALSAFQKAVQEICKPEKPQLRVFGSRSRQSGNEDSDVDVLVLLASPDEKKKTQIWDAAYSVFSNTDILISPLVLTHAQYEQLKKRERLIAKNIEKEGFFL